MHLDDRERDEMWSDDRASPELRVLLAAARRSAGTVDAGLGAGDAEPDASDAGLGASDAEPDASDGRRSDDDADVVDGDSVPDLATADDPTADADDPAADALDWSHLADLARRHGLRPALASLVEASAALDPPADAFEPVASTARQAPRQNLWFAGELRGVLDVLDDAGVRALAVKGPVAATVCYGELGARAFGDLDLLVVPADFADACAALDDAGFELASELGPFDVGDVVERQRWLHLPRELRYRRSDPDLLVELRARHGDRYSATRLAVDDLWADRTEVDVAGAAVPALSPTDRLVVLASHGSKHAWRRLEWLAGLVGAARRTDADWTEARARARDRNLRRELDLGALLAAELLDADVPDSILEPARRDPRVRASAATIADRLVDDPFAHPDRLAIQRARARLRGDAPTRALRFATYATPADYDALPLPRPLWPCYALVRPVRGLRYVLDR